MIQWLLQTPHPPDGVMVFVPTEPEWCAHSHQFCQNNKPPRQGAAPIPGNGTVPPDPVSSELPGGTVPAAVRASGRRAVTRPLQPPVCEVCVCRGDKASHSLLTSASYPTARAPVSSALKLRLSLDQRCSHYSSKVLRGHCTYCVHVS